MKKMSQMSRLLKDLFVTLLVGFLLAEGLLKASSLMGLSIPENPSQRPMFVIGILLFSLVFRLLIHVRE
jgi:high-affinity nickel permease